MEQQKAGLYLGIDISDKYTMLSIYQQHMTEPQTISTIMGSESYQIPKVWVSGSLDMMPKCASRQGKRWG